MYKIPLLRKKATVSIPERLSLGINQRLISLSTGILSLGSKTEK